MSLHDSRRGHVRLIGAVLAATTFLLGLSAPAAWAVGPSGYLVGYAVQEGASVCSLNTHAPVMQTPLYKPYNRNNMGWWYNLVEEAAFSNVTFLGLNFRGDSPCGKNNPPAGAEPTSFASNLVSAVNTRGYSDILKVALFDDTASYVWHRAACTNNPSATFNLGDQALWQTYIWDTRWLQFFQRVPDANRMKINGRPLVMMWSVNPALGFTNHRGNLRPLIQFLRSKCQTTFGFDPFIVVDITWLLEDSAVGPEVEGVNKFFFPELGLAWSKYTHNGRSGTYTTGVANPGFWAPQAGLYINRSGGTTLRDALLNTSSSNLLILEGLTDLEENAGYYRGANLCNPSCGSPYTPPANQCWSYANQYLNIVREGVWPYPTYVVYEAEASDRYQVSSVASGIYRRDGNLDIATTSAAASNWAVRLKANEWLEFQNFQLGGSTKYRINVRYASSTGATARLLVDGVQKTSFALGPTGGLGTYTSVTLTTPFSITSGNRNIRFEVQSGDIRIDNWTLWAIDL